MFVGNPQPLPPPDAFDALDVHGPALGSQHRRDPAIAIAAIPGSQTDDVGGQCLFIWPACGILALDRAVLAENLAGKMLRDGELRHNVVDAATKAGEA